MHGVTAVALAIAISSGTFQAPSRQRHPAAPAPRLRRGDGRGVGRSMTSPPAAAAQWAKICSTQPANRIRGCDTQGCGGYSDPRGGRKHRGVDVVCEDGSAVHAPFTGKINRQARPYGNGNAIDNGVQLSGSGFCIKMFYIRPIKYSGPVQKGEQIGVLLPMQRVYRGITSHVHIQNCDLTDPTPNL